MDSRTPWSLPDNFAVPSAAGNTNCSHTFSALVISSALSLGARPDCLWPETWSGMSKAAQKKEKHPWAVEKPKLNNSRKLGGIFFIDPDDGELKETIKNARNKLEIPMEAAMLCKLRMKKRPNKSREYDDETKGSNKIQQTTACMHRGGSSIHETAFGIYST